MQYQQIKPYGTIGYTVKRNYEGIKTWYIMRKMGTYSGYDKYNQATYNAVRAFQKKHGLTVTGNVNETTWVKMGFTKSSWTSIDSYVAPLAAYAWNGRSAHITAMIDQAYQYLGNPYLVGSSSSPKYGTDCSGASGSDQQGARRHQGGRHLPGDLGQVFRAGRLEVIPGREPLRGGSVLDYR